MKNILILFTFLSVALFTACTDGDPDPRADEAALEELLDRFLQGASENDAEIHDRFWAEDLIYTGSAGTRVTKEDIMDGLSQATSDAEDEDSNGIEYGYEDLQIMLYGETAIVAFRLVGLTDMERMEFYNTGTFLKRDGEWRAVAWQATRIPEQ